MYRLESYFKEEISQLERIPQVVLSKSYPTFVVCFDFY